MCHNLGSCEASLDSKIGRLWRTSGKIGFFGQPKYNPCPLSFDAFGADLSALRIDQGPRNGKAQTRTTVLTIARPRSVHSVESFEDKWQVLGRDTCAPVADRTFHALVIFLDCDRDR